MSSIFNDQTQFKAQIQDISPQAGLCDSVHLRFTPLQIQEAQQVPISVILSSILKKSCVSFAKYPSQQEIASTQNHTNMTKTFPFVLAFCIGISVSNLLFSQIQISSIHPIEDIQNHYKDLGELNASPRTEYAGMDTIAYPPELYTRYTLLFTYADPHYLTNSQVDFLANSVQYPANSSEQTRAELDFLLELQAQRTDSQAQVVLDIASIGYWPDVNLLPSNPEYQQNLDELFYEGQRILGSDCTAENYPLTAKLLQGVMLDMRLMEFAVKYRLLRARPYQLDTRITPLREIKSPSFASGHTLWAYIQAYTWGELLPEKRTEFVDLAYEIAFSRELMGVHYPSDEEAGRQLAHRMLWLMWHTEAFQKDFAAAKAEWE